MTIDIENTITKEFIDVVWEVLVEEVFEVCGVCRADSMGELKDGTKSESGRWGLREHFGDPVMESMAVSKEAWEVSNYGVRL